MPMALPLSPDPVPNPDLRARDASDAAHALARDGFAVLHHAVPLAQVDALRAVLDEKTRPYLEQTRWGGAARIEGHVEHASPTPDEETFPELLSDPRIAALVEGFLGPVTRTLYTGNTSCPGSGAQPVHRDGGRLRLMAKFRLPRLRFLHPPTRLVVNVPLNDFDTSNGATELWPGTHRVGRASKWVPERLLEERRRVAPPVQLTLPRGCVVIRHFDLWHRGMPNRTDRPRHMLALVYAPAAPASS